MRKITFLFFSVFLLSCYSSENTSPLANIVTKQDTTSLFPQKDSILTKHQPALVTKKKNCNCPTTKMYKNNYHFQLLFQKYFSEKADTLFKKWSNPELAKTVTSIKFVGFDTIPERYQVFTEVTKIGIENRKNTIGLDKFLKLKEVHFFGSVIQLNPNDEWTKKVEAIFAGKTTFKGLSSFTQFKNLRILYLAYSGFEGSLPYDLEKMTCLKEATFGAYLFGNINLNHIDLSLNPCLEKIEFQTWYDSMNGLPKGIENSNLQEIKIHHQQLTKTEKATLKRWKAELGNL